MKDWEIKYSSEDCKHRKSRWWGFNEVFDFFCYHPSKDKEPYLIDEINFIPNKLCTYENCPLKVKEKKAIPFKLPKDYYTNPKYSEEGG